MLSTKIVRTPTRAKGGITDEEKEQMRIITDKWIKNAFQTGEIDKEKLKDAIKGLYRVAKLKEPRVVIVPSPLIMALSYGLSAGWWEANNNKSSKKDVDIATRKAIAEATDRATYEATDEATREAAYEASMEVTDEATRDATIDAATEATDEATKSAVNTAIEAAVDATDTATDRATYEATNRVSIEATIDATDRATLQAAVEATRDATDDAARDATDVAAYEATRDATDVAAIEATRDATDTATDRATYEATNRVSIEATIDATDRATLQAAVEATRDATYEAADEATRDAAREATDKATREAAYEVTMEAAYEATGDATIVAAYKAIMEATDRATKEATIEATYEATDEAAYEATRDATDVAAREATMEASMEATDEATMEATDEATMEATMEATDEAAYEATDEAADRATKEATDEATMEATIEAAREAAYEATDEATRDATIEAAREATMEVTMEATDRATKEATDEATRDATIATKYATRAATDRAKINKKWLYNLALVFSDGDKNTAIRMLDLCKKWTQVYQGGNMWSAYQAYADAMQNVIKLTGLKCWENFEPYRQASIYGGFRVMHEKFCIVSEFPEILKVNANNRPHCETGPSHRWKDGFEIYHLNGIRVPKWLVMTDAGKIDPKLALTEKNVDVQREIIRKVGAERILKATNAKCLNIFVDRHKNGGNVYKLMKMKLGNSINRKYLYYEHASLPGVWYAQPVPPETKKALHARAWMLRIAELKELEKTPDNKIKKCLPMEVS